MDDTGTAGVSPVFDFSSWSEITCILADLFLLVFFSVIPGGLRTCRSTKRRLNCFSGFIHQILLLCTVSTAKQFEISVSFFFN